MRSCAKEEQVYERHRNTDDGGLRKRRGRKEAEVRPNIDKSCTCMSIVDHICPICDGHVIVFKHPVVIFYRDYFICVDIDWWLGWTPTICVYIHPMIRSWGKPKFKIYYNHVKSCTYKHNQLKDHPKLDKFELYIIKVKYRWSLSQHTSSPTHTPTREVKKIFHFIFAY